MAARKISGAARDLGVGNKWTKPSPCSENVVGGDGFGNCTVESTQQILNVFLVALRIIDRAGVIGVGRTNERELSPRNDKDGTLVSGHRYDRSDRIANLRPCNGDVHALGRPNRMRMFGLIERAYIV
ncbi:unannotated protein [freshwater metagenome]|uniref:Unannotated protein n=1 Tax=freshwater metagenome TaxID=449393 RepID=A0A6J6S3D8_9ZZZZ